MHRGGALARLAIGLIGDGGCGATGRDVGAGTLDLEEADVLGIGPLQCRLPTLLGVPTTDEC